MKKKYMLVLLSFLLVGCQGYITHIEDINGDDTRIATITDEDKIKMNSHISFMSIMSSTSKNNEINGSVKIDKFTGVKEIERINKNLVTYTFDIKINSGNFEVIIVSNDEIIYSSYEDVNPVVIVSDAKQKLKIVGESADFELTYTIKY